MFQLHRVVVPTGSGAATVPQPEHHDLRVARLSVGHGKGALFPPKLGSLPAFLNGLQELGCSFCQSNSDRAEMPILVAAASAVRPLAIASTSRSHISRR